MAWRRFVTTPSPSTCIFLKSGLLNRTARGISHFALFTRSDDGLRYFCRTVHYSAKVSEFSQNQKSMWFNLLWTHLKDVEGGGRREEGGRRKNKEIVLVYFSDGVQFCLKQNKNLPNTTVSIVTSVGDWIKQKFWWTVLFEHSSFCAQKVFWLQ